MKDVAITGSASERDGIEVIPMPADQPDAPPPARRSLAILAEDMRVAREAVRALRRAPIMRDRLVAARQSLLTAMESYAAELTARGLPVPRKLRDDLRLQKNIGSQGDTRR